MGYKTIGKQLGEKQTTIGAIINANKVINVIKCSFLDLFVDILSLTVKIDLPLQL